jgi:hypothetical protein
MAVVDGEPLRVGDYVRSSTGEVGELVALNSDGVTAYVRFQNNGKGLALGRFPLENLIRVDHPPESSRLPPNLHT